METLAFKKMLKEADTEDKLKHIIFRYTHAPMIKNGLNLTKSQLGQVIDKKNSL